MIGGEEATGIVAAVSIDMSPGIGATTAAGVVTCVAKALLAKAMTRSPGLRLFTAAPTFSTRPAHSSPSVGPAKPCSRISSGSRPSPNITSRKLRPIASTLISTSVGPGAWRAIASQCRRSKPVPSPRLRRSRAASAGRACRRSCVEAVSKRSTRVWPTLEQDLGLGAARENEVAQPVRRGSRASTSRATSTRRMSSVGTSLASVRVNAQKPAAISSSPSAREVIAPEVTTQSVVARWPRAIGEALEAQATARAGALAWRDMRVA